VAKIKLEILTLSSSQSQAGSFALVLGEVGGNRRLPIVIGIFEAQAIAIEVEKIKPSRPLTHDLFKHFADAFHFYVEEIYINDLREGVFYAQILISDGIQSASIDARPSDAIAIGIRFGVDIFTNDVILSEAGIIWADGEEDEPKPTPPAKGPKKKSLKDQLRDSTTEQLKVMLDDALNAEDYEGAAQIRDELNKRN
jgi:bifunctional DNase/RNase